MIEQLVIAYAMGTVGMAFVLGLLTGKELEPAHLVLFALGWPITLAAIVIYIVAAVGAWLTSLFD